MSSTINLRVSSGVRAAVDFVMYFTQSTESLTSKYYIYFLFLSFDSLYLLPLHQCHFFFVFSSFSRDKLHLKSVEGSSDSYAVLERKALLYDKLAKGQIDLEEEKEKYNVDFFSKGMLQEEAKEIERERGGLGGAGEGEEDEERRGPPLERGVGLEHKALIRLVLTPIISLPSKKVTCLCHSLVLNWC